MKKFLLGLVLISLMCCKSQNIKVDVVKDCWKKQDSAIIEKGLAYFESRLRNNYKGMTKEQSYIQFLSEFITKDIPPVFFVNPDSKTTRQKVKELNIWQLPMESAEEMETEIRLDGSKPTKSNGFLTLKSEFQNCLVSKVSNQVIKNFLTLRTNEPNLSSGLTVKYIYDGIKEKDLKNKTNRLAIAFGIYYEFALNLEK